MNKLNYFFSFYFLLIILSPLRSDNHYTIDHLEPPFWWTGMSTDKLQLMVHGSDISELKPSISYPGISIHAIHQTSNSNYLFIDLIIDNDTKAGDFTIGFSKNEEVIINHPYSLLERSPNSKMRNSFSSADVIYLITADRFANGDPTNDSSHNLKEKVNRKNKDGRHGGDIQGIIDHLDYLEEMGFTQIWLNPMLENDHPKYSYHGYSTTDYYHIDARFGGNSQYLLLSEEARKRGIGIIKDIVLNHCGSEHWWMKDLPSKDWINNEGKFRQTTHNRVSLHDIHTTNSETSNFVDGWFVKTMPDLNHKNMFMATYLIQNSIWWIEYANLSGFRIDTYPYHDKTFLTEFGKRLIDEYPNFNFVGEEWSLNPAIVSYWQKDSPRYDHYISYTPSMMDFPLNSVLSKSLLEKEAWNSGLIKIYDVISNDFLYGDPYNLVVFAGNHDMERIYNQVNEQYPLYEMAMTYVYTTRGIPQVYYGTEILLKGPADHGSLRTDFPGGWNSDKINGFNGLGLTNEQMEAQLFTKQLLNWRKNSLAVTKGTLTHYLPQNGVYVYFRKYKNELVMVLINNNDSGASVSSERFYEILDDKTQGISVRKKQVYNLKNDIQVPGKTALILDLQ